VKLVILSDHTRLSRWRRHNQALELTSGELIPGQAPRLKRRRELPRDEAIKLWRQKRHQGWTVCPPHWAIAPLGQSRWSCIACPSLRNLGPASAERPAPERSTPSPG
jgi:hypothetical protein